MDADDEAGDLTPMQHAAIQALLSSLSIEKAAAKAEVHERTLRKWLKDDANFKREYRAARRQVVEQAIGLMQKSTVSAVGVLVTAMKSEDQRLAFQAACAVIDRSLTAIELLDLADEVENMQRTLAELRDGRRRTGRGRDGHAK